MRRRSTTVVCAALVLIACTLTAALAAFDNASTAAGSVSTSTLAAPTSLVASGTGPITLTWTATASTYATGTRIMRGTASGGPYTQVALVTPRTTTTYVDTAVPGTYYYVVQAYYQQWTSANSNQVSATRAAVALTQSATGGGTAPAITATFTSVPVAGHLLVAFAATRTAGTLTPPSGWSTAVNDSGASAPVSAIFYKIAGASEPAVVTVTTTATGSGTGVQIYEVSGASMFLGVGTPARGTGTAVSSGSVTVTAGYSLVAAAFVSFAGNTFTGYTNSFVETADFTKGAGGAKTAFAGAALTATGAGTYSTAATTTTGSWEGQIAAFG
jgi:hypothetical protein